MCFAVDDEQNLAVVITEAVDIDWQTENLFDESISWLIRAPINAIELVQPAEESFPADA